MATISLNGAQAYEIDFNLTPRADRFYLTPFSFFTNSITINGTTYNLSDYPNGAFISGNLSLRYNSQTQLYCSEGTIIVRNRDDSFITLASFNAYGTEQLNSISGSVFLSNAFNFDDSFSYLYTYNRKQPLTITINNSYCNIDSVNPSSLSIEWGYPNWWSSSYSIGTIQAEFTAIEGYSFLGTNSTVLMGNEDLSSGLTVNNNQLSMLLSDTQLGRKFLFTDNITVNAIAYSTNPLSITNNLTDVSNDNPSSQISFGSRYQATLTPIQDYHIDSITITMGGIDITSTVYNEGVIDIPSVTGDIVITAVGRGNPTVTYSLTGCTSSNTSTEVEYKSSYVTTITPNSGYSLEDMTVLITMGGVEQFNVYNNGVINIPEVTGDLVITLIATTIKTFNFKSMDGLTNFLTVNLVKISTLLFTIEGNTRRLVINGVNYTWVDVLPNEKQLIGLSLTANSNRYVIPLDVEVVVNYNQDTTFYEVIIDRQEQADTFSMILYKNNTQNERVDKTSYLEYKGTLNGTLRSSASVLNPQITIEWEGVVNFNYVYVPIFNRYYFVTDVIYTNKSLVTVNLRVDVLMSHKNAIYQQNALIGRNEYQYNEYLVDEQRLVRDDVIVEFIRQDGSDFFNPDVATNNIIVDLIGGQE